jgi:hypothetical protein
MHVVVIKAVLAVVAFTPSAANLAFVSTLSVALAVGSAYGWIETSLYRRNKAWLNRLWPKQSTARAPAVI